MPTFPAGRKTSFVQCVGDRADREALLSELPNAGQSPLLIGHLDQPNAVLSHAPSVGCMKACALASSSFGRQRGLALNALALAFSDAIGAGKATANPCKSLRVPRQARTDEDWTCLTSDEIGALFDLPRPTAIKRAR